MTTRSREEPAEDDQTPYLRVGTEGILLTVHVQPKGSRDRISGLHGEAVKLSITAPPVDGKANQAVGRFLARFFGLPGSAVTLRSGQQSRTKKFLLQGLSLAQVRSRLAEHLSKSPQGGSEK
jgi:uncharacterized protein